MRSRSAVTVQSAVVVTSSRRIGASLPLASSRASDEVRPVNESRSPPIRSRAAVASCVVLAAYVLVGLLDSLHFRPALPAKDPQASVAYAVEVRSVLDVVLTPLRARNERTYSAPLATRLYEKQSIEQPGGGTVRDYPRLRHGGSHLKSEADWGKDVALRVLAGRA